MKQTLIDIRWAYRDAALAGKEPTPYELGEIIKRHLPAAGPLRDRYLRGMGVFVGQAMAGLVIDPQEWTPPD